ncbi:MAG: DUF3460 family protein [Burkholderiales bacterium]|nr:DUF3460 family protein [Burkholderiales bacterium]
MKNTKYTSDAMNFINQLVKDKHELKQKRQELRSTWWDKSELEVDSERELNKDNLKSDGYTYFSYK